MKILLTAVNAKYIHSNPAVYSLRASSGICREHVEIAEYTINQEKDTILRSLYEKRPEVLCFSCYIWNITEITSLITEFHKLCPEVPIWCGGPEVSYETEEFLGTHFSVTGVMIGEGEDTFRELCAHYTGHETEEDLEKIPGLMFRKKDGSIFRTADRLPADFSSLPFYYDEAENFENRIIYYESSRGCPFSCSYCLSSVDKHLRFRNTDLVLKELQFFLDRRVPQVKFVDRTFNCSMNHALRIWRYIQEHDNGITNFHFEISADLMTEEALDVIRTMRPGLVQFEIGVQSVNETTLHEIHRITDLEKLKQMYLKIRSFRNVHQHLDLIAGLPDEDLESFRHSFNEIYALKPEQLQLGFLKVLKGSYMYDHAAEYGLIYQDMPPYEVLKTNWLSFDDLIELKSVEEMLELYYNSGQFEVTMKLTGVLFKDSYDFFKRLGDYYREKGYDNYKTARIRKYEILLDFLKSQPEVRDPKGACREESAEGNHAEESFSETYREGILKDACREESAEGNHAEESFSETYREGILKDNYTEESAAENHIDKNCSGTHVIDIFKEALTADLYLREDMKSRPAFAIPLQELKKLLPEKDRPGSHTEAFHFSLPGPEEFDLEAFPDWFETPELVRFDYTHRDPLTGQAGRTVIR